MKIYLNTVGCRLNQSEIEKMANQFIAAGHELVDRPDSADLVVVNTCSVTGQAAADSRRVLRLAKNSGKARIVATGCWATLEPGSAASLSETVEIVTNAEKEDLVLKVLNLPDANSIPEPLSRHPLPGSHHRTRAFIKIQDGCDNHCTFCVTRIARGSARSRPVTDILKDIYSAVEGGALEVVLSGVQISSWGKDFDPSQHLFQLIEKILKETQIERLRLSSIEPWNLDNNFFSLWQEKRLCRHLHLPLQSGSASVLHRMARKISPDGFARLVEAARLASPEIAVTTDMIVGFPGESSQEFEESLSFIEQVGFSGGHIFNFSARPQTPAAHFPDQVPPAVRKERSARLRSVFANLSFQYSTQFAGSNLKVLWESAHQTAPQHWYIEGLTDNYLRVGAYAAENLWNQISLVNLQTVGRQNIQGVIIK